MKMEMNDPLEAYRVFAERAREEVFGIEDEICVLDVETTGFSPERDRIIEVAIARMRGPEVLEEFSSFVNPGAGVTIPRGISELTGISDADVEDAPLIGDLVADIRDFIGERDVLAHNAGFDRGFIEAALLPDGQGVLPGQWLDSLVFLRCGMPLLRSYRQEDLMRVFCPEEYAHAHRAIYDVRGLCRLWRIALVALSALEPTVLRALPKLLADTPERAWLAQVAELYAPGKGALNLRALRSARLSDERFQGLPDAGDHDSLNIPPAETIAHDLTRDGLAGAMYEAFEPRPEQEEMALAIREAIAADRHLVVEAGTGVGKSLAYLVCLARLALDNNISVGVATKTNALTDQLMHSELPALATALRDKGTVPVSHCGHNGTPEPSPCPTLRYTALKGYSHYPCLRKLDTIMRDSDTMDALPLAQLIAWVSQTTWGELSTVNLALSRDARRQFAASAADCNRRRCRYYSQCYLHGTRRRAKSSHIVVTNHALLFANAATDGHILPPIRYWVVDEAHNLETEARKQLARAFDERELRATLRLLVGSRALPARLLKLAPGLLAPADCDELEECAQQLTPLLDQVVTLSDTFFAYAQDMREHSSLKRESAYANTGAGAGATYWIGPELRESAVWGELCNVGSSLSVQMEAAFASARALQSRFASALGDENPPAELSDFGGLLLSFDEQAQVLARVIAEPEENSVYSLSISRPWRGSQTAAFEIAQLEVGPTVAEELLATTRSVVMTSATLAVGDSFARFTDGVGLAGDRYTTLQLPSSYDLPAQMRILIPNDLPEPSARAWLPDLQELLREVHLRLQGGVLTLFTSRRDLLACRDALQDELAAAGLDVLAQDGAVSPRILRERFVADHHTSLLATKSFWEGFDASGDTLRCVIIPKLPFGRPDDPLARERAQVYGRSAWARYDLPDAILELKQAVGRLIRSSTDTGTVILADTRVLTRNYGSRVMDALPISPEILSTQDLLSVLH